MMAALGIHWMGRSVHELASIALPAAVLGGLVVIAAGWLQRFRGGPLLTPEERARRADQRLNLMEQAIASTGEPVFGTRPDGRFFFVNDAACRSLGYTRDELLQLHVSDVNLARSRPDWPERWNYLRQTRHVVYHSVHRRKDGSVFPVEITTNYVDFEGGEYLFAFARDITERANLERAQKEARDELEKRVAERTLELTREVDERRRAETALQKSEARLRGAVEGMKDGFALYDADDRLVMMNDRFADVNPLARDFLEKGGTFEELVRANIARGAFPAAAGCEEDFLAWRLERHRNPGEPVIREMADGRWILVQESRTAEGGTAVTFTDITELKRTEAELKRRTELFDTAVNAMDDALVVLDRNLCFVAFNNKFWEIFGIPRHIVSAGTHLSVAMRYLAERGFYGPGDPDALIAEHLKGFSSRDHRVFRRRLGDGRVLETRRGWLPDGGVISIHTDVTANARLEETLREARDQAERANQAKSIFLANMSHEIRTPMNGILGVVDMLAETHMRANQRAMLDIIQESCRTLNAIIDGILDFSKIEAGRMDLEDRPFDAGVIVETVAEMLSPQAREHGTRLSLYIDPAIPSLILGDDTRVRQILFNLIGNAVKFTRNGSVTAEAERGVGPDGAPAVLFRISDTGIGVSADMRDKLFQPFEQGDSSTARHFGGSGLGLSICKALVKAMGGDIGFESRKGKGSCFWFRLPLRAAPDQPPAPALALSGRRALLFTEAGIGTRAIEAYLRRLGAEVIVTGSLQQLQAMAEGGLAEKGKPDLLVLDHDRAPAGITRFLATHRAAARHCLILTRDPLAPEIADLPGHPTLVTRPLVRARLSAAIATLLAPDAAGSQGAGATAPRRPDYAPPAPAVARAAGALVLLAEDNAVNRRVLGMMLERLGFSVETASDGAEAWRLLERPGYGLLIADCHMPGMDGYELARRVRERERRVRRTHLPIVALTADAIAGTRERCLAAGMDDYLAKPVDRAALNAAVLRWLPQAAALRRVRGDSPPEGLAPAPGRADGILDLFYLNDAVGGDDAMIAPLLNDYLAGARALVDDLLRALGAGDFDTAREAAHAAKGNARLAGAVRFANLCEDIEMLIAAGDTARARDLSHRVEAELAVVARAAAGYGAGTSSA